MVSERQDPGSALRMPGARGLDPVAGKIGQILFQQVVKIGSKLLQSKGSAARLAAKLHGPSGATDLQHGPALPAAQAGRKLPAVEHHAKDPSMLRTVSRTSLMIWS